MSDESRIVKDPVCGKDVDTLRARAVAIYGGVTCYFCSAECKAKYTDPRQAVPATPPRETGERRREAAPAKAAAAAAADVEPVRYAKSRIRRITGEVSTPVVQIDLSPNKKPAPQADSADDAIVPARSNRGWVLLAIVMVIIAGAVIFFTLKHR